MTQKKTVIILLLVLLLMGGVGAASVWYLGMDRREPELTLRTDVVSEYGQALSMYELIDRVDDESSFSLSVNCPQGSLSADGKSIEFPGLGSFQVEMTARDEHGNAVTQSTVVSVVDTTPPELKAEEFTVYVGKELKYQEHVTAQDAADGDLSASVRCSTANVNINEPGRYPINYSVTDSSGNTASLTSYVTVSYPPAKKITLNQSEVWLAGNEYVQLKAKVKPSDWHGQVEWKSSHPQVAEVSDGLVVWKSVGECVITATAGKKEATCTIHCESPKATEVRLNRHHLELAENEKAKLTARVLPSNWTGTVEWSSSDPAVAKVDQEGNVTWVGGGTCTITATADECAGECKVTCKRRTISDIITDLFGLNEDDGNQGNGTGNQPSDTQKQQGGQQPSDTQKQQNGQQANPAG